MVNLEIKLYISIGMFCIVLANIMTYIFFVETNKSYENTIKSKLLEQQNENLKNNISDNEAFVKEMRSVRHDIKHHLITILKYINDNKGNEAKEYISSLTNDYLPNVLNYIDTGNIAFDGVVNSKIAICNQKGVSMGIKVKSNTNINLPPEEIAVLFGNLLDNAIEASQLTKEKKIFLNIQENESYLIIMIKNSIIASVLEQNAELITSKKDKQLHGIGIKSIKNIVDKHNGMIQFYEEDRQFCCHIMINK